MKNMPWLFIILNALTLAEPLVQKVLIPVQMSRNSDFNSTDSENNGSKACNIQDKREVEHTGDFFKADIAKQTTSAEKGIVGENLKYSMSSSKDFESHGAKRSMRESQSLLLPDKDFKAMMRGARVVLEIDRMVDWNFIDKARIDGFNLTKPEQYPYSIMVIPCKGKHTLVICTGSLLTTQWVLTAAHCFKSPRASVFDRVFLVAGGNSPDDLDERPKGSQIMVVDKKYVHVHPDYKIDNTFPYDLALLRLIKPFDITATVGTITLSSQLWHYQGYHACQVTGFGMVQLKENNTLDHHRKTHMLQVATSCKCCEEIPYCFKFMICNKPKEDFGVCTGDSGSGLICDNELVGVTSAGLFFKDIDKCVFEDSEELAKCGVKNTMSLFAPTGIYLTWINSVMKQYDKKPNSAPSMQSDLIFWPTLLLAFVLLCN